MSSIGVYLVFLIMTMSIDVFARNLLVTLNLSEERPPMTTIGNILTDSNLLDYVPPEDIQNLRFTFLTEGNPQASYLWINSTSGELKTFSRIDRESICPRLMSCELRVQTVVQAQLGAFFMIVQVVVTILDINDNAPTFMSSTYTVNVSESALPGTSFRLPVAIDTDMGQGHSIVGYNAEDNGAPFTLVVTGSAATSYDIRLRLDENVDRESIPYYQILVRSVDGGNPKRTGTLTVNIDVIDVNDNSPIFEKLEYMVNISESTPVNSLVIKVSATDLDAGANGVVTYSMPTNQEDSTVFSIFYVNETSGEIKSKIPLDSFAGRSYKVTVEASDSGPIARFDRTLVVITILDTHNSDPEIVLNVIGTAGLAQVSELAELGRVVALVTVSDPDSSLSSNGVVSCSLENTEYFQLQAMDIKQYKVILTKRLDREHKPFHSVTVLCEDAGTPPLNSTANFIVEVEDENDNAPVFDSLYYATDVTEGRSSENSGRRNAIVTVRATDRDTGPNGQLTYRLAEETDSDFGIYTDGSIVVTNPYGLDREDKAKGEVRQLVILAVDGGKHALTGTTTVVITIRDINDNPPKFSEPMYYFSVAEDSPVDHMVSNVSATDADLEGNAIFYFKMDERDISEVPFKVTLSGLITVSGHIDTEVRDKYEFRVIAYDLGQPFALSSTVTVHIRIVDINDNSPVFVFPNEDNYTLYVAHTLSENTAFASILATDRDQGRNGELVYTRDSGNGSLFFDVVTDSGQVVLVKPLSLRELGLHVLAVVAHDRGQETQMATQTMLHIIVYEGNATIPLRDESLGFRNIVVVVVLVVVTVVLALAILLTIILIRRVDKQRRLYSAKDEEAKVESNLRHLNPCSSNDLEAASHLSEFHGDSREGGKKKKEVSFSLDEEMSPNPPALTTFSPLASDKYDSIADSDRGKMKNDMLYSNQYLADRHAKSSSGKKEFNFHQVHPTTGSNVVKNRQPGDQVLPHEDNLSDVSTSDSGRGGSDVELQSHGGNSKDSGDISFASQKGFIPHNNLNAGSCNPATSTMATGSTSSLRNVGSKSVHFQNIRPDPTGVGTFLPPAAAASSLSSLPPRSPVNHSSLSKKGCNSLSSTQKMFPEEDGSYIKLTNGSNGRRSNPSNQELELHRNRILNDSFSSSQNSRNINLTTPDEEYMDMTGMRTYMSQRSSSNSCIDGTGTWDGDTTTSGSYTVDPQELCDEIDKLFFDNIQDVVV